MNLFHFFGIGANKVLSQNQRVPGTVTAATPCRWLSIKTKPVRLYTSENNTIHPYAITFTYRVDSASYTGKLYIPLHCRVPQKGETIEIYYDPDRPRHYACYSFGPGYKL